MRRENMTFAILGLTLALMTSSCSSNPSSPDDANALKALAGTWKATEVIYTSKADSTVSENILETMGFEYTMTIKADGSYTVTTKFQGQTFNFSGTFNEEEDGGIGSDEPNTTVTVSGNTLTMIDTDTSWDFDKDGTEEPAILKMVFVRQ